MCTRTVFPPSQDYAAVTVFLYTPWVILVISLTSYAFTPGRAVNWIGNSNEAVSQRRVASIALVKMGHW